MPDQQLQDLNSAMREWQEALVHKADFPETQIVLAGIALTTRRMDAALRAFGEATKLDPQLTQAWMMMVRIQHAMGNNVAARAILDRAIEINPDSVELNLMRTDMNRLDIGR